jgi:Rod binding domain-containing protein
MVAPLASFAISAAIGIAKDVVGGLAQPTVDPKADKALQALDPRAEKARKTATDFETLFMEQTLDRMVSSLGDEGPLGENGSGGGVYRSMLLKEYAGGIVKSGGLGIADQVYREMMRLQEGSGQGAAAPGSVHPTAKM